MNIGAAIQLAKAKSLIARLAAEVEGAWLNLGIDPTTSELLGEAKAFVASKKRKAKKEHVT